MGLAKLSRNIYFKPIPRGLVRMCSVGWDPKAHTRMLYYQTSPLIF